MCRLSPALPRFRILIRRMTVGTPSKSIAGSNGWKADPSVTVELAESSSWVIITQRPPVAIRESPMLPATIKSLMRTPHDETLARGYDVVWFFGFGG